ncbi:DegT/DnrJ/EryC1/StrS family aminotransferase [Geomonas sp. Red875]|uniref:DegT/DnrJ/EryC1/StrS family aminotransferase n=1 Tax=Geomesophilobacter sediminis TaxID=2798584 RepID=A0A8J7M1R4_9BACT|nr:DegT/DnrJ/EryC1/StrS family aminotransferase [Geomesophilobacter sediminis]
MRFLHPEEPRRDDGNETVPFLDLKAQYRAIEAEVFPAVRNVLEKGCYILGDEVAAFEKEFATYQGAEHGIGVNSGTSSLHLALLAAGVGPGDEVITVSCTFVATVAAIIYSGARPVLVDVNPLTLTIDPSAIEKALTRKTKAIIPVHLHGHPADMDPILEIGKRHNLVIIEDACQAHGAEYKGRRVGSIGTFGCFSFYPGKNLGAYGEGGMVVTNDASAAEMIRKFRDWGTKTKYHHELKGYNYRMEGIQGAILRVKLRHLEQWTEARRKHAARYHKLLDGLNLTLPVETPSSRHVYHIYAIQVAQREKVQSLLTERGIQTGIHYPVPVHLQPAYYDLGYKLGNLPNTEAAAASLLSLPMFPELTARQQDRVVEVLKDCCGNRPQEGILSMMEQSSLVSD